MHFVSFYTKVVPLCSLLRQLDASGGEYIYMFSTLSDIWYVLSFRMFCRGTITISLLKLHFVIDSLLLGYGRINTPVLFFYSFFLWFFNLTI